MNEVQFARWRHAYAPHNAIGMPLIVGILNVTPNSFSDGGRFWALEDALNHAGVMIEAGADVLDIGGESSQPGAPPISLDEELSRVIPVIEGLRNRYDTVLSVDTYKPEVMRASVGAGAGLINDIKALRAPGALSEAVRLDVPVCLMHMQGEPQTMQDNPGYTQPIEQVVSDFFTERVAACSAAGIPRTHLMLDPGFGFGKTVAHNLRITQQLSSLIAWHRLPVWFGCSRKSTLGLILNQPVTGRLAGGLGLAVYAALQGVSLIRTHDVAQTRDALRMVDAVIRQEGEETA